MCWSLAQAYTNRCQKLTLLDSGLLWLTIQENSQILRYYDDQLKQLICLMNIGFVENWDTKLVLFKKMTKYLLRDVHEKITLKILSLWTKHTVCVLTFSLFGTQRAWLVVKSKLKLNKNLDSMPKEQSNTEMYNVFQVNIAIFLNPND